VTAEGPLLAIDTSTTAGSVAVGDGDRLLAEVTLGVAGQHSTALMPAIDATVRWAGLARRDLRGVVVAGGPGSFTGLRIGAATAKGIVATLGVPLWSYSGLLATAAGCAMVSAAGDPLVCAMFDARRRDVYAACYRFRRAESGTRREGGGRTTAFLPVVQTVMEPAAMSLDEVLERYGAGTVPLFTGEAAVIHADEIEQRLGAHTVPSHLVIPRASSLLWLTRAAPAMGWIDEPAGWEPDYLRASGAERIAAARKDQA
jgi:tRNA threonylcarbamoyladenosine biosynthesis protein TsaB